jgi:hypothetical protein
MLRSIARCSAPSSAENAGVCEVGRAKEELRTKAALRRWIEVVAPSLLWAMEFAAGEAGDEARAEEEVERKGRRVLDAGSQ